MVSIRTQEGTTVDIVDKKEMERSIIKCNKKKFQQAFGTPFYNHPYNKMFGYKGTTEISDQVLKGNWNIPESTPDHIKSFLSHVATPQVIQNNPTTMKMTLNS